jgi:hypothetical protein
LVRRARAAWNTAARVEESGPPPNEPDVITFGEGKLLT